MASNSTTECVVKFFLRETVRSTATVRRVHARQKTSVASTPQPNIVPGVRSDDFVTFPSPQLDEDAIRSNPEVR